jgi:hypothetical protein
VLQVDHVALQKVTAIRGNIGNDCAFADRVPARKRAFEYFLGLNFGRLSEKIGSSGVP